MFKLLVFILMYISLGAAFANDKGLIRKQAADLFVKGNKIAILVGVSRYNQQNTGFTPLQYAANDMEVLAKTLSSKGYEVIKIVDHNANKHVILNRIEQISKLIKPNQGTLVFAFSGHGYAELGQPTRLATFDTIANKLSTTGLSISDLVNTIRKTGVKRAMLFIDACRNNPTLFKSGLNSGPRQYNPGEGIQILYSTRKADVSIEHPSLQQGVFSYFLNRGLLGKAEDQGIVSFSSLARYVEREVPQWSNRHGLIAQQPFRAVAGEHYGDFVLASRLPITPTTSVISPPSDPREPEMMFIKGSHFMMGSPDSEIGRREDEGQHVLTVKSLYMGKTEITVGEFKRFVQETKYRSTAEKNGRGCRVWSRIANKWMEQRSINWKKPGFNQTDQHPVVCVSQLDALAYANWLSNVTGKKYSLPTEAQWEYAARAGSQVARYWGENADQACLAENVLDQAGGNEYPGHRKHNCYDGFVYTAKVGSYRDNRFGLKDMLGNVREWTCSAYSKNYDGSEQRCAPSGHTGMKVLRGGSWINTKLSTRSATRIWIDGTASNNNNGFRLTRVAP